MKKLVGLILLLVTCAVLAAPNTVEYPIDNVMHTVMVQDSIV